MTANATTPDSHALKQRRDRYRGACPCGTFPTPEEAARAYAAVAQAAMSAVLFERERSPGFELQLDWILFNDGRRR